MAVTQEYINLFKTKAISEKFLDVATQLRRMSYLALFILVIIGGAVGFAFVFIRGVHESRTNEKNRLTQTLTQYNRREGLLLSVKERVETVKKVDATRKPWVDIVNAVSQVAAPPQLQAIVQDDQNRMALNIRVETLEETLTMTQTVLSLTRENLIKNPQLSSLTINRDGTIAFGFSFIPVF